MRKILKLAVGNVKRKYSTEDFNPFRAVDYIYENLLHTGVGGEVLIVGHTPRFQQEILKAWQHVLLSRGIMSPQDKQPLVIANEFRTHTGALIKFKTIPDTSDHMMDFDVACKESTIVALCSPYKCPNMLNIIRETNINGEVYDFSQNNLERVVDS
jgi:hypothetical protein